jgi:hypothetical protein
MIEVIDEILIPGDPGYTHRLLNIRYNGLEGTVVYLRHDNDFRCDVYLGEYYSHFGNLANFDELTTNFEYSKFKGFITGLAELLEFNPNHFNAIGIRKEVCYERNIRFRELCEIVKRNV